jgi:sensor histidine kinase YesM
MPRLGPKKVEIQFLLHSDELLYCTIRDNGIGRAASQRLKNNHEGSAVHHSKGLSLVHERLQILEQLYQRPYQVEVVDKTDPSGVVEGTEVNLTIHVGP